MWIGFASRPRSSHETISEPVNSGQGHQYPSIQLSGNVRAIFGDVYGADGSFFTAAERPTLPLKRQYYEQPRLDESSRHAARFAAALSQDYEVVSTAMNALRKLDTDLSRSLKQIRVRHTIFKLTLRSLLVPFTGSAVAYQMLQDSQHAMWAESDFVRYLDDFFGFSSEAVEAILDLISQDLDGIAAMAEVMVCHHVSCAVRLSRAYPPDLRVLWNKNSTWCPQGSLMLITMAGLGPRQMLGVWK